MSKAESVKLKSTDSIVEEKGEKEEERNPGEKWRIIRNIVALSLAFMVQFTAYFGASNLQSSINAGLGQISLATLYVSLIFSTVFLPLIVTRYLGCKWTVAASLMTYMPYIAAQYHPEFYTLIPGAIAVGLGAGPLWCAACTYVTVIAESYSIITRNVKPKILIVRFFGLFFMISQTSQIWGSLIASIVLSSGESNDIQLNYTLINDSCGAKFSFGNTADETLLPPSKDKISMITSIYLGCMVLAVVIVAFFVDPLSSYDKYRTKSTDGVGGFKLLAIALKLLKDAKQLLLLPITIWMGVSQAFLTADFTAAFVTCSWGVNNVGYVMIFYGLSTSVSSILTGWLVKLTGRRVIVLFATILHIGIISFLLNWVPTGNEIERYKHFIVTGIWGLADGVWLVQINAFCGIVFPGNEEAAYSIMRLWESVGYIAAYSYSVHLSVVVKLYIALTLVSVGFIGYSIVEYLVKQREDKKISNEEKSKPFELSTLNVDVEQ